ncbi:MAG: hypothetical protein KER_03086 [Kerstersia gyiorum]|uniref:hypothetical protein n=1 Tax=Kerstersia gyiorum TaxID=206506 RepID=UPI0030D1799D
MSSVRNLKFIKHCTNTFGKFVPGDRAQGRFPQDLIESYLKHGILIEVAEPIAVEGVKSYAPPGRRRKAA